MFSFCSCGPVQVSPESGVWYITRVSVEGAVGSLANRLHRAWIRFIVYQNARSEKLVLMFRRIDIQMF
jgi:hypothetical protein